MFQSQPTIKLHIASILTSSHLDQPPDRQGILYKKNNRTASYQRCWCELRGNLLIFREQPGDRAPSQLIVLEGCTVELQESTSEPHTFKICYPDDLPDQSYKMAAEDQETMEDWVRALSTAGFEYLRALVTELESQFHRLKSQQYSKEEASCKATDLPLPPPKPVEQRRFSHMDFACLHQEFGKDVKRTRIKWQERKGKHVPETENSMHFK
ncbi:sesquipedalian-1-like isoform X2 [Ahaetulla prasina]|uniref:sesquipedalian-1-like isoform X2 n=1 Tax=Ahaetulla prasina TaxID=499056 RepID=UPI002649BA23|nr:sesquipedalian-1-like isoform X2 [Ahaetulla prasina]XP_058037897.1 sesquipedalian-1-like isoform X2 [Ahaetulla prasina]XP_058037898.1 sesquipedalian-1-like isoform X2 [Ahaetulla prasina]